MARVVSDTLAKTKCKEWLEKNGFTNVRPARNQSCDLIADKDGKLLYIEIKYSSKEEGSFFGTVMLTEMFQAVCNKENYLFLVCRGQGNNLNDWFFRLFDAEEFLKCCTLTTPIFLYRLESRSTSELTIPEVGSRSTLASEKLIKQMWSDFAKWKNQEAGRKEGKNE
ncbi:MAG: hypothetical protein V1894_04700 [Chloroflexota bacterium]